MNAAIQIRISTKRQVKREIFDRNEKIASRISYYMGNILTFLEYIKMMASADAFSFVLC